MWLKKHATSHQPQINNRPRLHGEEIGRNGIGGWSTKTRERAQKDLTDNRMQHEGQAGRKTCTGRAYKVRQPFSFVIYCFTNINPTSSTLSTSLPTSALVPTIWPPGGLILAKPTTPLSLSPLLSHLGGSILKHELSHPRFCKNNPLSGHSCKLKGRGACVCKDDHPRPRSCKGKGRGACICKDDHPRPRACKCKLPPPSHCVSFHTDAMRGGNPLSVVFQFTTWTTQCPLHHQMWQCQCEHWPSSRNPLHIEQHALLAHCFRRDEDFNIYFIY